MGVALFMNPPSIRIGPDEADARQRKRCAQSGQIDQNIERTAAIADRFAQNIRQRILLGIGVNDFEIINDPVASGEDSLTTAHGIFSLINRSPAASSSSMPG